MNGDERYTVSKQETLRIGTPMKVRQANPIADYNYSIMAMLLTHDTLVRFDDKMQPYGQLAESWSVSSDGRQWRFILRDGVKWHDGRPVTSEDVAFTFRYLASHHGASAWIKEYIGTIETDEGALTFNLIKPCSRFLINGGFVIRILPKHVWASVADPFQPGDADITLGCGPFLYGGFDMHMGLIRFDRNPDYYGPRPTMTHIEMYLGRTADAITISLIKGEIDLFYKYASGYQWAYLPRLKNNSRLRITYADGMGVPAALGFNTGRPFLSDPVFRRAIAMAFDYPRLKQCLLGADGQAAGFGFVPPAFGYYDDQGEALYEPDKCRTLMTQLGCVDVDGDGFRNQPGAGNLRLHLLARSDLEGTDGILPVLIHNLEQVGIEVELERVDLSAWIDKVGHRQYDLVLFRTTPWGMMMHAGCATGYFDARRDGGGTLANIVDPEFRNLCDRVLETNDADELQLLRRRIQQYYAERLPRRRFKLVRQCLSGRQPLARFDGQPDRGRSTQSPIPVKNALGGCGLKGMPVIYYHVRKLILYGLTFLLVCSLNFCLMHLLAGRSTGSPFGGRRLCPVGCQAG